MSREKTKILSVRSPPITGKIVDYKIEKEANYLRIQVRGRVRGPPITGKIGDYKIEKEAKYLGIQVGGRGRDIFNAENKLWIQKAKNKANGLIGQIKKSCDLITVGKAIWKLMAVPAILYGRAVVTTRKTNINNLQRIENRVWRCLLGIGGYATVETLRGEINAPMVKSRIIETMLAYIIDVMKGNFTNVKDMMMDTIKKQKGKWYTAVDEYREELGITWDDILAMDRKCLKDIIRTYDTDKWREGLDMKVSMRIYSLEKEKSYMNYVTITV